MPPARRGVVVEEPDRAHPGSLVPRGGTGHEHPGLARAVQQRRLAVGDRSSTRRPHGFGGGPDAEADAAEEGDAQQQLDRPEGAREPFGPARCPEGGGAVEDRHRHDGPERGRADDPLELRDAGEPPATAVQAEPDVDGGAHGQQEEDDQREGRDPEGGVKCVEPHARGRDTRRGRCRRGRSPGGIAHGCRGRGGGSPGRSPSRALHGPGSGASRDGAVHGESGGLTERRTANVPPHDCRVCLRATERRPMSDNHPRSIARSTSASRSRRRPPIP